MTILSCHIAAGDDLYVRGEDNARYTLKIPRENPNPFNFKNYNNNGYSQEVAFSNQDFTEIKVYAHCEDLNSEIPFPIKYKFPSWLKPFLQPDKSAQSDDPEIISLTKQVIKGSEYQYEAVQKILRWINDNITYNLDPEGPRTAVQVLREKKGFCIGYSNLAIAMLRSAGIPCRNVHGIHIDSESLSSGEDYIPLSLKGVTLHRWIEVYYPDVGWVFSDPKFSTNFIGANYIFLAHQDGWETFPAEFLEGVSIKTESSVNGFKNLDWAENGEGILLVRPSRFQRKTGLVNVWIMNSELNTERTEVTLASLDKVLRLSPGKDRKVAFTGLDSGEYELKIRYNGELVYLTKFGLKDKQELNFDIMLKLEENSK